MAPGLVIAIAVEHLGSCQIAAHCDLCKALPNFDGFCSNSQTGCGSTSHAKRRRASAVGTPQSPKNQYDCQKDVVPFLGGVLPLELPLNRPPKKEYETLILGPGWLQFLRTFKRLEVCSGTRFGGSISFGVIYPQPPKYPNSRHLRAP